jgi:hypothetical protein
VAKQSSFLGLTIFRSLSVLAAGLCVQDPTNNTTGKRGNIGWGKVSNTNAAGRYLKFYDSAAAPVVGTTTPIMTIYLPPTTTIPLEAGPLYFANGIWIAATNLVADSDTTAPSANDVIVNIGWK